MRRHGVAVLGGLAALTALLAAASPAAAGSAVPAAPGTVAAVPAARAGDTRGLPRPPACANAVAISSRGTISKPVPLPPPASDAGGARLAQPGLQVALPAGVPRPPALRATAWIVADLATGDVLAACNAHVPLAPASALKILTAVALHPRINATSKYVARPEDAAIDGTKVGLSPGSVYTVDNLWHGLLMGSGNDTANALAALAGGMPAATDLMTQTARSVGALDTVVANTSGLDAKGQVSSVYDLAIIGRALLHDPALAAVVRTKTYAFPGSGTRLSRGARRTFQIQNHDLLLFRYPGATGIKNGYTTAAGASFVGSASRGGHSYVVALLRTDFESWRLAAALLDWAFAHGTRAEPVGVLAPPGASPDATTGAAGALAGTAGAASASAGGSGAGSGAGAAGSGAGEPGGAFAGAAGRGVPSAVAAPVAAALRSVPAGSRTTWLVAAFVVAVAGGAAVRVLTARWPAGGGPRWSAGGRKGRRPATSRTRSGSSRGGRAPAAKAAPRRASR